MPSLTCARRNATIVWFALKDPRVLASTVLWYSSGGRHRGVLGLEDVASYFHIGLAGSAAPNPASRRSIRAVRSSCPTS
ncbi:MAG: hypothetical protein EXS42_04925 [Lacunisphaera sp.]|nr:hypothetical protein [Lacunisphaera sp.]